MILDQRQMFGCNSIDQIVAYWTVWLDTHGVKRVDDNRTVTARVDHSRWIADCPNCNDGIAAWIENPNGCCLGCGHVYKVKFPSGKVREAGEAALLERTDPRRRNWSPADETPTRLRTETRLLEGL